MKLHGVILQYMTSHGHTVFTLPYRELKYLTLLCLARPRLTFPYAISHHIMSRHVTSREFVSHHVTRRDVTSHRITLFHSIASHRIALCGVTFPLKRLWARSEEHAPRNGPASDLAT